MMVKRHISTTYIKSVLLIGFWCTLVTASMGQPLRKWVQAADKSFNTKDYYSALKYYQVVIEFDSTKVLPWYKMARSAREINAFSLAEHGFQKVSELDVDKKFPLNLFYLADVRQHLGNFEQAEVDYLDFLRAYDGQDPNYLFRAQKGIEDCRWAKTEITENSMNIELSHIDEAVNTGYSEFGAALRNDTIWYTSYRFEDKGDNHWPRRKYFKVMTFDTKTGENDLYEDWNTRGKHSAHVTFNTHKDIVYYSICEYGDTSSAISCQIFKRVLQQGKWTDPIPTEVNLSEFSSSQPNLGRDAQSGKEILYFSSDRPGGKGGFDIWYAEVGKDGQLSEAYNLEEANTLADEISPFFHEPSQKLYFSSDGRLAFGGMDIYRTARTTEGWGIPSQMGYPLNGTYDDAYFSLNEEGTVALFASNRIGSTFLEPESEACCFDIWRVDYSVEAELDVFTYEKFTNIALNEVTVELIEVDQFTGEEMLVAELTNYTGNDFHFPIAIHKKYLIRGTREGYSEDLDSINLLQAEPGSVTRIERELFLMPPINPLTRGGGTHMEPFTVDLEVLTFDEVTQEPVEGCTVSLEPINPPDDLIGITQINSNGNDFLFPIRINQAYQLSTNHPEYEAKTDTLFFSPEDIEELGTRVTVEVYLRRLFNCLPLVLYYDNNVPGPKGYNPETDEEYVSTYEAYYLQKDKYIATLTEGLSEEEAFAQREIMETFFERDVKGGYENLRFCTGQLLTYLENGNDAIIKIVGSASPRGPGAYNKILSQRRINCVLNFLLEYSSGAIQPYIDNKRLVVQEDAIGERTGNLELLDKLENFDDVRSSIYSLPACLPRSVEISRIEIVQTTSQANEYISDR